MADAAVKPKPAEAAEAERELTDGFHLIIDALKLNGLNTIYGVPGIPITDFGRMAQAAGIRVISFRHEQNAGNAAAIAGFLTKQPGVCLTVSAPGFLNGLTALANATTNCFPMILISGSSEREIVDLQQGDYEEMDQLAIAKPLCKAAFRVLHAADIGIGVARAIRAAVSGRPGGVYLDLPAKLFGQVMDAEKGARSLVKVIDPAPAQIPAPDAVKRALDVFKSAKRPLIILGKGAAYAQADDAIRALVEKSGVPFLPMSMGKGLLPDTHPQCAGAARSTVLKDSDVVMLIGARLNWLLSHGKGKAWGDAAKKFIQIDIEPKEMDSNVEIVAPVVGDIGSCVSALLDGMGGNWPAPQAEWLNTARSARSAPSSKNGRMPFSSTKAPTRWILRAASSTCTSRASGSTSAPGASWASAWAMRSPRPSRPASRCSRSKATVRLDSPAWRSRQSAATSCRSVWSSSITTASTAAPTSIPPVRIRRRPFSSKARATTR
jgi:oxalyl-CoA decarboxylase